MENAVCHILVDTKTMLVLEFRNVDFSKIEIVVFSGKSKQDNICLYPILDKNKEYEMDGKVISENGVDIPITMPHTAKIIRINKLNGVSY